MLAIWGSRLPGTPKHVEATNILSVMKRLVKGEGCSDLMQRYEELCELAHPNQMGFARFVGEPSTAADGAVIGVIDRCTERKRPTT